MEVFPGITMNPDVCEGKPCASGTSVAVATIVGTLGTGKSFEDVEEIFQVTREHIFSAIRYASYVTDHLPLKMSPASSSSKTG